MATRTRLTTPPGHEPVAEVERSLDHERYSPGIALPTEPRPPGRHRRTWVLLAIVAIVVVVAVVWFQVATAGQSEDPALTPIPSEPVSEGSSPADA